MFTAEVSNGNSVTVIVLMVSQPPVVLATVSITWPAAVNTCPSNVYGNSLAQTARLTAMVSNGSSVTVIVLMVSQPHVVLATVSITRPAVVNTCPSNVYGNSLAHTARLTAVVSRGSSVIVIVLIV